MVTNQLQVECRTTKERWPETDVITLSHADGLALGDRGRQSEEMRCLLPPVGRIANFITSRLNEAMNQHTSKEYDIISDRSKDGQS